jgi:cob(I)alamin adenosyltransferase
MSEKGFVQVYTGNGKGKTTAALGLALRAAASGKKVFIGQFVKGMHYSELDIIQTIENIEIKQYGADCFIYNVPTENDIRIANEGLAEMARILKSGKYDVVIMDEANIALYFKLFTFEKLWEAVSNRAEHVEVVSLAAMPPIY